LKFFADRHGQEKAASAAVPGRPEPLHIAMNTKLKFRGIRHWQHRSAGLLCEASCVLTMRLEESPMINRISVKETVGGREVRPVLDLVRSASIGPLCKLSSHSHESFRPSYVAEIAQSKLLLSSLIHIENHLKHHRPPPYARRPVVRLPPGMHHTSCEVDWRKWCTMQVSIAAFITPASVTATRSKSAHSKYGRLLSETEPVRPRR
jgi:hypothetical protein